MNNFEFYNPTKIIFGNSTVLRVGAVVSEVGKKALLVSTRVAVKRLGVLDHVKALMHEAGVKIVELLGVEPNPKLSSVTRGAELCKAHGVDVIVALGGGSVIDCAKAIALAALDDGDPWDYFIKKRHPKRALPIVTVLTISGTGSEMNVNSVVTNDNTKQKLAVHNEMSFPVVSIIDPELHKTVPKLLTACGMVDTIIHVLDVYFDGSMDTPMQDRLGEGIVQTVLENEAVLDDLTNTGMRANLAWASSLALNDLNIVGRHIQPLYTHKIEHEIGGMYDVIHAAGLAPILAGVLEVKCQRNPAKFAQFGSRVFGLKDCTEPMESGRKAIAMLKERFAAWGMPMKLSEIGVQQSGLDAIARRAAKAIGDDDFDERTIRRILEISF